MRIFTSFNFSRVRNEDFPIVSGRVAAVVTLRNPATLHLTAIQQYLIVANLGMGAKIVFDKKLEQTPDVLASLEEIKRIVGAILQLNNAYRRGKDPLQAQDLAFVQLFISTYVKSITGKPFKAQLQHLTDLFVWMDAAPALLEALEALQMKNLFEALRINFNVLNARSLERTLASSKRKVENFASLRKVAEKAIRDLLRGIESHIIEFPELDYSLLVADINAIITEEKRLAESRSTRRENLKQEGEETPPPPVSGISKKIVPPETPETPEVDQTSDAA